MDRTVFLAGPVIPVITLHNLEDALPLANALLAGGIKVMELTLRTSIALAAIELISKQCPQMLVGAGTVITEQQLDQCINAGAKFALSPGSTKQLLSRAREAGIPFIPGVSSVSEIMEGMALGYDCFKLFPATVVGGCAFLKAVYAPLPQVYFCPTGGIDQKNYLDYLELPNVDCVGGSWLAPDELIRQGQWEAITQRCHGAVQA